MTAFYLVCSHVVAFSAGVCVMATLATRWIRRISQP